MVSSEKTTTSSSLTKPTLTVSNNVSQISTSNLCFHYYKLLDTCDAYYHGKGDYQSTEYY